MVFLIGVMARKSVRMSSDDDLEYFLPKGNNLDAMQSASERDALTAALQSYGAGAAEQAVEKARKEYLHHGGGYGGGLESLISSVCEGPTMSLHKEAVSALSLIHAAIDEAALQAHARDIISSLFDAALVLNTPGRGSAYPTVQGGTVLPLRAVEGGKFGESISTEVTSGAGAGTARQPAEQDSRLWRALYELSSSGDSQPGAGCSLAGHLLAICAARPEGEGAVILPMLIALEDLPGLDRDALGMPLFFATSSMAAAQTATGATSACTPNRKFYSLYRPGASASAAAQLVHALFGTAAAANDDHWSCALPTNPWSDPPLPPLLPLRALATLVTACSVLAPPPASGRPKQRLLPVSTATSLLRLALTPGVIAGVESDGTDNDSAASALAAISLCPDFFLLAVEREIERHSAVDEFRPPIGTAATLTAASPELRRDCTARAASLFRAIFSHGCGGLAATLISLQADASFRQHALNSDIATRAATAAAAAPPLPSGRFSSSAVPTSHPSAKVPTTLYPFSPFALRSALDALLAPACEGTAHAEDGRGQLLGPTARAIAELPRRTGLVLTPVEVANLYQALADFDKIAVEESATSRASQRDIFDEAELKAMLGTGSGAGASAIAFAAAANAAPTADYFPVGVHMDSPPLANHAQELGIDRAALRAAVATAVAQFSRAYVYQPSALVWLRVPRKWWNYPCFAFSHEACIAILNAVQSRIRSAETTALVAAQERRAAAAAAAADAANSDHEYASDDAVDDDTAASPTQSEAVALNFVEQLLLKHETAVRDGAAVLLLDVINRRHAMTQLRDVTAHARVVGAGRAAVFSALDWLHVPPNIALAPATQLPPDLRARLGYPVQPPPFPESDNFELLEPVTDAGLREVLATVLPNQIAIASVPTTVSTAELVPQSPTLLPPLAPALAQATAVARTASPVPEPTPRTSHSRARVMALSQATATKLTHKKAFEASAAAADDIGCGSSVRARRGRDDSVVVDGDLTDRRSRGADSEDSVDEEKSTNPSDWRECSCLQPIHSALAGLSQTSGVAVCAFTLPTRDAATAVPSTTVSAALGSIVATPAGRAHFPVDASLPLMTAEGGAGSDYGAASSASGYTESPWLQAAAPCFSLTPPRPQLFALAALLRDAALALLPRAIGRKRTLAACKRGVLSGADSSSHLHAAATSLTLAGSRGEAATEAETALWPSAPAARVPADELLSLQRVDKSNKRPAQEEHALRAVLPPALALLAAAVQRCVAAQVALCAGQAAVQRVLAAMSALRATAAAAGRRATELGNDDARRPRDITLRVREADNASGLAGAAAAVAAKRCRSAAVLGLPHLRPGMALRLFHSEASVVGGENLWLAGCASKSQCTTTVVDGCSAVPVMRCLDGDWASESLAGGAVARDTYFCSVDLQAMGANASARIALAADGGSGALKPLLFSDVALAMSSGSPRGSRTSLVADAAASEPLARAAAALTNVPDGSLANAATAAAASEASSKLVFVWSKPVDVCTLQWWSGEEPAIAQPTAKRQRRSKSVPGAARDEAMLLEQAEAACVREARKVKEADTCDDLWSFVRDLGASRACDDAAAFVCTAIVFDDDFVAAVEGLADHFTRAIRGLGTGEGGAGSKLWFRRLDDLAKRGAAATGSGARQPPARLSAALVAAATMALLPSSGHGAGDASRLAHSVIASLREELEIADAASTPAPASHKGFTTARELQALAVRFSDDAAFRASYSSLATCFSACGLRLRE